MPYSIITHSGKAHIDEILAIAALIVHKKESPEFVERMDSTDAAEMVTGDRVPAGCWIIDCGLEYDPDRRLFDHHQDRELPSAALMMFSHLFPDLKGSDIGHYFELVSRVDTRGGRSLDDSGAVGESRDYWSFAHQILVKVFEKEPLPVLVVVAAGLKEKIRFEGEKKAASEWVAFPGRLVDVDIDGHMTLEYTEKPPIEIADGLKGIDGNLIEEHHAEVVYGYDKTDASIRTLYRTDIGHDGIDFCRAEASNLLFCHQGGFLMRFRPSHPEEWKHIVRESIVPAD